MMINMYFRENFRTQVAIRKNNAISKKRLEKCSYILNFPTKAIFLSFGKNTNPGQNTG